MPHPHLPLHSLSAVASLHKALRSCLRPGASFPRLFTLLTNSSKAEELVASIQTVVVHNTMDVASVDAVVSGNSVGAGRPDSSPHYALSSSADAGAASLAVSRSLDPSFAVERARIAKWPCAQGVCRSTATTPRKGMNVDRNEVSK